jgi:hypothetical protein
MKSDIYKNNRLKEGQILKYNKGYTILTTLPDHVGFL